MHSIMMVTFQKKSYDLEENSYLVFPCMTESTGLTHLQGIYSHSLYLPYSPPPIFSQCSSSAEPQASAVYLPPQPPQPPQPKEG